MRRIVRLNSIQYININNILRLILIKGFIRLIIFKSITIVSAGNRVTGSTINRIRTIRIGRFGIIKYIKKK